MVVVDLRKVMVVSSVMMRMLLFGWELIKYELLNVIKCLMNGHEIKQEKLRVKRMFVGQIF